MKYFYVDTETNSVSGICDYIPELPSNVKLYDATPEQIDLILSGHTDFVDGKLMRPNINDKQEAFSIIRSILNSRLNSWAVANGFADSADAMSFANSKTTSLKSKATFAITTRDSIFIKSTETVESMSFPISKDDIDSVIEDLAISLGI